MLRGRVRATLLPGGVLSREIPRPNSVAGMSFFQIVVFELVGRSLLQESNIVVLKENNTTKIEGRDTESKRWFGAFWLWRK